MMSAYNILYKLTAVIIRLICRFNGGLDVKGKENIPARGGVIIAANHISYLDPPVLGAVIPRRAAFMARRGLFKIPLLGLLIKHTAFPVDRERTRPSTIKEAVRRLKNEELVVMFPEGKRSETGEILEAKRGIGMVANLSKVPVIPTLIAGTEKALPPGAMYLKRAKIFIIFGKPKYYTSPQDKEASRNHLVHEEISNKIITAIKELKKNFENKSH